MSRRPIAVFDSGIGGLPYLEALRALLPNETYLYVADREGFPYGRRTREDVRLRASGCVDAIVSRFEPKMIVIACNTASQAALPTIRSRHADVAVVGTVPAVKPAARATRTGTIAVLATDRAASDPYLDRLVETYARGVRVLRIGAQELVEFVENRFLDSSEAERLAVCGKALEPVRESGADFVVLACTHFLHLASYVAKAAGESIQVIDSREGVAHRAASLARASIETASASGGGVLYATGEERSWGSLPRFAKRFGLEFGGAL